MPLHLLGKKSWNVYNTDNIARVRRDEALAQAEEEAEERRMQEHDADRRIAILRGEMAMPAASSPGRPEVRESAMPPPPPPRQDRERRKRKRHGEDDTEFEMRVAREKWHDHESGDIPPPPKRSRTSSAPLVNRAGHIDLFGGAEDSGRGTETRGGRAGEKATEPAPPLLNMKLSDAGGKDDRAKATPWYTALGSAGSAGPADGDGGGGGSGSRDGGSRDGGDAFETRNVFGMDDPGRRGREIRRMSSGDPLLAMKSGAARAREVKAERRREREERGRELESLKWEEMREQKERGERRRDMVGGEGGARGRDREGDHDQARTRDRGGGEEKKYRSRAWDEGGGGERSKDIDGYTERDRNKDKDKDMDMERDRGRDRGRDGDRNGDEDRGTSRQSGKSGEKRREIERWRGRSPSPRRSPRRETRA